MNYRAVEILIERGQLCGKKGRYKIGDRTRTRSCRRFAGHDGSCSRFFDRRPLSESERLERKLATTRAEHERAEIRVEHLSTQLRAHQAKIARIEGYRGYRIQYRLIGGLNRLRRWRWELKRRLV